MPTLEVVVRDICTGCAKAGVKVTEVLAGYVARLIIEGNPADYDLRRELRADDINRLVTQSISRLVEKNSPALETVKMQVGFDCCYVALEEDINRRKRARAEQSRELQRAIINVRPKNGSDFDALTGLYRQIFGYLAAHYDATRDSPGVLRATEAERLDVTAAAENGRNAEREVAAALESVFPRIGLKSFIMLAPDQKRAQLEEMANIVLGIRLFNREIGKGGALLDPIEEDATVAARTLLTTLQTEATEIEELCLDYQQTLVYSAHERPAAVTDAMVQRWAA